MSEQGITLEDFKARLPLADIVGRYVKLTRRGREHTGLCPFHQEKSPSFNVVESKGFYHCFGCGAHGNAIDFVMAIERLEFVEALNRLAEMTGIQPPRGGGGGRPRVDKTLYDVNAAAALWFEQRLLLPESGEAQAYLRRRNLRPADVKDARLGWSPNERVALKTALLAQGFNEAQLVEAGVVIKPEDGGPAYDRFRGRVMFPIADQRGRIVAFGGRSLGDAKPKYLNSPETALFDKGRQLYALDRAFAAGRDAGPVVVAEGYMDVIALRRAGYGMAVAPLGTAMTEEQLKLVWKLGQEPVFCLDGDEAGLRAAGKAARRALPLLTAGKSLRIVLLPPGEDPDSLVHARQDGAEDGATRLRALIDSAMPLGDFLWREMVGAGIPTMPERRAALRRDLRDLVRLIVDADVRTDYARFFKARLDAAGLTGSPQNQAGEQASFRRTGQRTPFRRSFDGPTAGTIAAAPASHHDRTLLRPVLREPTLLEAHEEAFAAAPMNDQVLRDLRAEILAWYAHAADLDAHALLNHLRRYGFGRLAEQLLTEQPFLSGGQAASFVDGERARWRARLSAKARLDRSAVGSA